MSGEKVAMRLRWQLVVLVLMLITVMFLKGQVREASIFSIILPARPDKPAAPAHE
jgi:hypothetical protein